MPVRDWGLAYSQFAIFFEDRFAAWRLMRALPSNSRGLSAWGISGEDEEKQQHFCYCSSPFYSAACVGPLLSVALIGCIFSIVRILAIIAFTRFIFQTRLCLYLFNILRLVRLCFSMFRLICSTSDGKGRDKPSHMPWACSWGWCYRCWWRGYRYPRQRIFPLSCETS